MERIVPWENRLKKWLERYKLPAEEEKIRITRNRKPNYNLIKQQMESQYKEAVAHNKAFSQKEKTRIKAILAANHVCTGIRPKHHMLPVSAMLAKALSLHLEGKTTESAAVLHEMQKTYGYSKERLSSLKKKSLETFKLFLEKLE